jgi:outer membrane protein TolC
MFPRFIACLLAGLAAHAAAEVPLVPSGELAANLDPDRAVALALAAQPQFAAREAGIHALQENAVAAGELPDPKLTFGLQALPTDTFSFTQEAMTQAVVGVSQAIPGGAKRDLSRRRVERDADLASADLVLARRKLERDVRLAWLDLWQPTRALGWLVQLENEFQQQIEWGEVAYKAGKLSREEILQWQAQREIVRDRQSEQKVMRERARAQLVRWVGQAGEAEPAPELPAPEGRTGKPFDATQRLDRHPELLRLQRALDVARADAALAKEAARPDWNVNLAYGARGANRADLLSFTVGVDLPIFQVNRQDRRLAARLSQANQIEEQLEDQRRQLRTALRTGTAERDAAVERAHRYQADILPLQEAREAAALADYRAGKGAWGRVLDTRRAILETRLQLLTQQAVEARAEVQLRYLIGE